MAVRWTQWFFSGGEIKGEEDGVSFECGEAWMAAAGAGVSLKSKVFLLLNPLLCTLRNAF